MCAQVSSLRRLHTLIYHLTHSPTNSLWGLNINVAKTCQSTSIVRSFSPNSWCFSLPCFEALELDSNKRWQMKLQWKQEELSHPNGRFFFTWPWEKYISVFHHQSILLLFPNGVCVYEFTSISALEPSKHGGVVGGTRAAVLTFSQQIIDPHNTRFSSLATKQACDSRFTVLSLLH